MPYGGGPGGGGGGPFPPRLLVRRKQDRMGGRGLSEGEPYPGPVHQLQFRCVARLEAARPRCRWSGGRTGETKGEEGGGCRTAGQ